MAGESVSVVLNKEKIDLVQETLMKCAIKAADATLSEIKLAAVIPRDLGELQRRTFVDYDVPLRLVSIVSDEPYARRLYYNPEYHFSKLKNANAQGLWFEPWIVGSHKDFIVKAFNEFVAKELP